MSAGDAIGQPVAGGSGRKPLPGGVRPATLAVRTT